MNEGQSPGLTTALVPCSVCNNKTAIYRCPGCFIRTCSLSCCLSHKEKSGCDGKRNRVGFVPLHRYNDSTLSSDYHFLEDILTKSEHGKRLIKEVGADTRLFSHGSKRRRIDESSNNNNNESCNGEISPTSIIPIQPLLRLKVEDDKEGLAEGQEKDQNDLTAENVLSGSSSVKTNPIIQEKATRANDVPTLALSTEKEEYLKRHPAHRKRLVKEAHDRGIELLLMAQGMQRHLINKKSTKYDKKKDLIHWKVEFIIHDFTQREDSFININDNRKGTKSSNKVILTSDNTPESAPICKYLSNLLERNSSHSAPSSTRSTLLRFCNSQNRKIMNDNVCALMKRIPCKSSQPSYKKVNLNSSLKEVLKGTTVIEFPTIEVVLEEDLYRFPVFIQEVNMT